MRATLHPLVLYLHDSSIFFMCLQIIDDHTDQNCCIPAREALTLTSLDLADLKSITLLRYAFFPFLSHVLGTFCSCFCLILILEGLYVLSSVRLHFQGATGQWQESMTWLAKVETSFAHVKPQYKVQSNTAYTTYTCKYVIIRYHTSILSRILLAQVQAERMEASYST